MNVEESVPWLPITKRPRLEWPDGCRLAVWVCPNLEHYDYLPPVQRCRDPWPRMRHPDVLGYGEKDYGNRVGAWRVFRVLEHHGIRATVSGGLTCFSRYPEILEKCLELDWDCMCHGLENTSYLWDMPADEERRFVERCCTNFESMFGRKLKGWFSPAASHTPNTLDLIAEAGVEYFCDWYHDDQPFPIHWKDGTIITLPYSMELNDVVCRLRRQEAPDFTRMVKDAFDRLWREGAEQGRVLCIAMHPYVSGQPHWIGAIDELFGDLRKRPSVWWTTGAELSDWYYRTVLGRILDCMEHRV